MVVFQKFITIDGAGFVGDDATIKDINPRGASAYEAELMLCLAKIHANPVGRILLHWLKQVRGNHEISIYRYYQENPSNQNDVNAFSLPVDRRAAVPFGQPLRNIWGNPVRVPVPLAPGDAEDPVTGQRVDKNGHAVEPTKPLLGTGGGSSIVIGFTPGLFTHQEVAGMKPDEVLVHEFTHSYRELRGTLIGKGVGCVRFRIKNGHWYKYWSEPYPNVEEFLAVIVANIYMSARNSPKLRTEYFAKLVKGKVQYQTAVNSAARNQRGSLRTGMTPSETFMLENYGRITQLFADETAFLRQLAKVDTAFNPFRDYEAQSRGN